MNRDNSVISRALLLAGQEPLTDEDRERNTARYRAITDFYLPAVLSVMSAADWTELRRRAALVRLDGVPGMPHAFRYALPDDCARAVELAGGGEYEVEGHALYTDDEAAVLVYVSNGRRASTDFRFGEKYGDAYVEGRHYDLEVRDWRATGAREIRWTDSDDDYPEYVQAEWSPELTDCITATLAAQVVLKITGDKQLYAMLTQMAAAAMDAGGKVSRAKGASRTAGQQFWGDSLGVSSRSRKTW